MYKYKKKEEDLDTNTKKQIILDLMLIYTLEFTPSSYLTYTQPTVLPGERFYKGCIYGEPYDQGGLSGIRRHSHPSRIYDAFDSKQGHAAEVDTYTTPCSYTAMVPTQDRSKISD